METSGLERRRRRGVVLVPSPFQGHITPMLQLGSILHSKGFSIHIAHTKFNSPNPSNFPHFTFLPLPDNLECFDTSFHNLLNVISVVNANCEAPFQEHMMKMVADEEFKDVESYFKAECQLEAAIPQVYPLRFKDLPLPATIEIPQIVLDFMHSYMDIRSSSAVIWNTIDQLDHWPLQQLEQHWPVPFFSIGPFHRMAPAVATSLLEEENSCLSWLDKQAPNSVIYASLGSVAIIDENELIEMAWGLAKSEQPFLWAVRPSLLNGSDAMKSLPEEFIKITQERGMVVKWAPQKKVLAHPAVGGFLTHCGWNSTLESMCEGVPLICRPCFADQLVNARYLTYVWRVGIELQNARERTIEEAIRTLMTLLPNARNPTLYPATAANKIPALKDITANITTYAIVILTPYNQLLPLSGAFPTRALYDILRVDTPSLP
ncbi:UNVERIFIED_CONTAM: UDP-glucose iridoid glucosyltransferase [Sesamum calycinum]|uniref:Glycosyltransferase n=1 Tax=Sesamum calycinum TaxID=2727403 RepID=A0AAW2IUR8_9LAMI